MSLKLSDTVESLPKIGGKTAFLLSKLGINTLQDFLFYFPFRYDDLSQSKKISELEVGETASVTANLWQVKTIRTRTGKFLTTALLSDSSGTIEAVWFNQAYLEKSLKRFNQISVAGKTSLYRNKMTLLSPSWEPATSTEQSLHTSRLVPVYPQTEGVNSKWLRSKIRFVLDEFSGELQETLPQKILEEEGFLPLAVSLEQIHFPKSMADAQKAQQRFAFEELLVLQLANLKKKKGTNQLKVSKQFKNFQSKIDDFLSSLPFIPTSAQRKAIQEVLSDLTSETPMNRLLQGDVGSGKTLVATVGAYLASLNGQKTLFMAPTEILAQQHFQTIRTLLSHLPIRIGLVTGSQKFDPEADVILGTSALLNISLSLEEVGLVVIDEQHRFGVEQRNKLRNKGFHPHLLTLSATPIPRTMALIFFGELDLSILDEMPENRKTPRTFLVTPEKRDRAYEFLRKRVAAGEQVFIICPLIDPSETLASVRSVKTEWERLSKDVFPDFSLGLLHGRLSSKEKLKVLTDFRNKKYHFLVATPVVEVGIDIPNATVILIEAAERFGLASLHQLRGRVGRGEKEAFCLLFTESGEQKILERLKNMERLTSGFALAEADLSFRGPGQVFGTLQHGLPDLKIASFSDSELISKTKKVADRLANLDPKILESASVKATLEKNFSATGLD